MGFSLEKVWGRVFVQTLIHWSAKGLEIFQSHYKEKNDDHIALSILSIYFLNCDIKHSVIPDGVI